MAKITMQTIADTLNISKVSVSNALSGKSGVSVVTKEKVFSAARELGYPFADPEAKKKVALLIPKRNLFSGNFAFYSIISFRFLELAAKGFDVTTIPISNEDESRLVINNLQSYEFIVMVATFKVEFKERVESLGIPIIQVDTYRYPITCDTVYYNNFLHGYQLTSLLLANGHTDIGFIGDLSTSSSRMDRYFGMKRAMMEKGVVHNPAFNIPENFHEISAKKLELPSPMPTAFVCHSDKAAFNIIVLLENLGYSIPHDVSIVSFDNIEQSKRGELLTTVDIDEETLAQETYNLLVWRRDHPEKPTRIVTLNGELVVRNSIRKL